VNHLQDRWTTVCLPAPRGMRAPYRRFTYSA
jgi:hypothetical protein